MDDYTRGVQDGLKIAQDKWANRVARLEYQVRRIKEIASADVSDFGGRCTEFGCGLRHDEDGHHPQCQFYRAKAAHGFFND